MKRFVLIVPLLLVFFSPVLSKSYDILSVNVDLQISENGLVNVHEQLTYVFEGCFSEVYRYIPLFREESVVGFEKSTQSESVLRTGFHDYVYEARIIFSEPVCDKEETVAFNYSMLNVVRAYDDASEINFKMWGDGWPSITSFTGRITFPNNELPEDFWFKPFYGVDSLVSDYKGSKLITVSNLPEGQWLEFRALFQVYDGDYYFRVPGLIADSAVGEMEIQRTQNLWFYYVSKLAFLLVLIPILVAVLVYFRFGIEPRISYFKTYENELPTQDSPAFVNALMNMGHGGAPDEKGFLATIFNVVRKGHARISTVKSVEKKFLGSTVKEDFVLSFRSSGEKLSKDEEKVFDYLKSVSHDNKLAWSSFLKDIKSFSGSRKLKSVFEIWKSRVMSEFRLDDYYVKTGNVILFAFSIVWMLLSALVYISFENSAFSYPAINILPQFILSEVVCVIIVILNLAVGPVIFGRRTERGTLFFKQWRAFKKFLGDYSMIKQYPPESVKVWEYYLVYAIALGEAETVIKAMKLLRIKTDFEPVMSYPGFYTGFYTAMAFSGGKSSSGGFRGGGGFGGGGFGGGSGGGGGGAR